MTPRDERARRRSATPPHNVRPWPLPRARSPRVEGWRARLSDASGDRAAIDRVVASIADELRLEGTPIVEAAAALPDGPGSASSAMSLVTFVWIGEAPHGVALQLNRMTDAIDLGDTRLEPLAGSTVHTLTLRLPETWLGSYLMLPLPAEPTVTLHRGIDPHSMAPFAAAAQADPFAREHLPSKPVHVHGGDAPMLSAARAAGASTTALWRDAPGHVSCIADVPSAVTGTPLRLSRWSHPEASAASPVVLLCDGEVWRVQFPLWPELSRRIEAGSCAPLHLLYLDSGGPHQRQLDYTGNTVETAELLARVRTAAGALAGPWIVAGQSLGGLFAAHCALRHPELVSAAIAQSPSLWWPASPPESPEPGWFEAAAEAGPAGRVLLQVGAYEWGLVDRVRDAAAVLAVRGELIGADRFAGGHDVLVWQSLLPDAIGRVLGDRVAVADTAASRARR